MAGCIQEITPLAAGHPHLFEIFEEYPILAKYKEGDNFNHRNTLKYFEDRNLSLTQ